MIYTHAAVICTKDRPTELKAILSNLVLLNGIDVMTVLIIENSANMENKEKTWDIAREFTKSLNLKIYQSAPGLPRSRNLALTEVNAEIITFLDDDVILDKNFFYNLDKVAYEEPSAAGFGGVIVDRTPNFHRIFIHFRKYIGIFSKSKSVPFIYFSRSNWNNDIKERRQVNWIPGCAMSFRTALLGNLKFNEKLENGPTQGYALGEDFDFTYKLSRKHKLIQDPNLRVEHFLTSTNRSNSRTMEEAIGRWVAYQDKIFTSYKAVPFTVTILIILTLKDFIGVLLRLKSLSLTGLRLRSYIKELVKPSLS